MILSDNPPARLDKALAEVVPEEVALSRTALGRLIETGAVVRADGTVVDQLKTRGQAGEAFVVTLPAPDPIEAMPEDIPLTIVYEDADLIVLRSGFLHLLELKNIR